MLVNFINCPGTIRGGRKKRNTAVNVNNEVNIYLSNEVNTEMEDDILSGAGHEAQAAWLQSPGPGSTSTCS